MKTYSANCILGIPNSPSAFGATATRRKQIKSLESDDSAESLVALKFADNYICKTMFKYFLYCLCVIFAVRTSSAAKSSLIIAGKMYVVYQRLKGQEPHWAHQSTLPAGPPPDSRLFKSTWSCCCHGLSTNPCLKYRRVPFLAREDGFMILLMD